MKDAEDEAFDELAKKQGSWGGGFQAKRAMAADKLQQPAPNKKRPIESDYTSYVAYTRALERLCDTLLAQPAQEPEREALKLALEALENAIAVRHGKDGTKFVDPLESNAITAIQAALAQPVQEPVAWMVYTQDGQSVYVTDNPTDIQKGQRALPLYTTPPQRKWVGLTDEEICLAWLVITDPISLGDKFQTSEEIREFVRAIEAKLKEKNNGT